MMVLRIVGLAALVTVARGTLALARSPPTRLRTRFCAGGGIAAACDAEGRGRDPSARAGVVAAALDSAAHGTFALCRSNFGG
eukprot:COSAG06_NODE_6233_length_3026_cov_5.655620_3_plen_82_part_00